MYKALVIGITALMQNTENVSSWPRESTRDFLPKTPETNKK